MNKRFFLMSKATKRFLKMAQYRASQMEAVHHII